MVNKKNWLEMAVLALSFCLVLVGCEDHNVTIGGGETTNTGIYSGNGHKYEVINQSMSWTDSRAEATRRGGYLAIITDAEEQAFIEGFIVKKGTKNTYWLGGYINGGSWIWADGTPFSYTNWASVEPSNTGTGEDRLVIIGASPDVSTWRPGEWGDMPNTDVGTGFWWDIGFVVEFDN
jgi:hypothetical protein